MKTLSQNRRCLARDSNKAPAEYKFRLLVIDCLSEKYFGRQEYFAHTWYISSYICFYLGIFRAYTVFLNLKTPGFSVRVISPQHSCKATRSVTLDRVPYRVLSAGASWTLFFFRGCYSSPSSLLNRAWDRLWRSFHIFKTSNLYIIINNNRHLLHVMLIFACSVPKTILPSSSQ
jgi:hypothetical protein